ncbi:hypothetical protein NIES2107_50630 [Nostoc carneum NIES-2107]|nr:hypothetical protein NIES2107_50630 [Nostoc carneum NIES-2107]
MLEDKVKDIVQYQNVDAAEIFDFTPEAEPSILDEININI